MQKPLPLKSGEALYCLEAKCETITYCLRFEIIKNNKARLLDIAKFLGEIRSRIIPNYKYQIPYNHSVANEPSKNIEAASNENRLIINDNLFQERLGVISRQLGNMLIRNIQCFIQTNPADTSFTQMIIAAGHLTKEEANRISE